MVLLFQRWKCMNNNYTDENYNYTEYKEEKNQIPWGRIIISFFFSVLNSWIQGYQKLNIIKQFRAEFEIKHEAVFLFVDYA